MLQLASPDMALRETQRIFYALDLNASSFKPSLDDSVNLLQLRISEAEKDGSISQIASTYDFESNLLRDGVYYQGKKVITFSNILLHDVFPLAEILELVLRIGQKEMNKPVEIEFAVNLSRNKGIPHTFNLLQIRPIVDNKEMMDVNLSNISEAETVIYSNSALGNGVIENLFDFVYVKPEAFDPAKSTLIAQDVSRLNDQFLKEGKNYILVGPGRWGSTDPWLGIPVKWPQISAARIIVESGKADYRIDPSQGTHFFQNLTSFRVGYFTINPYIKDGYYDLDFLNAVEPVYEDEFIRHLRFDKPLITKIDGRKNRGVILKPF